MNKIRYSYRKEKEGFRLDKVKCPICGSIYKNFKKVVEHTSWSGKVKLLVECWSGDTSKDLPHHLYLINIKNLPIVDVKKIKVRKPKQRGTGK